MSTFQHQLIRRFGAVIIAATALATATTAKADWTENRRGCSYTCHWYLSTGTCKGPFGIRGPCVTKNKRCSKDFCTRSDA